MLRVFVHIGDALNTVVAFVNVLLLGVLWAAYGVGYVIYYLVLLPFAFIPVCLALLDIAGNQGRGLWQCGAQSCLAMLALGDCILVGPFWHCWMVSLPCVFVYTFFSIWEVLRQS